MMDLGIVRTWRVMEQLGVFHSQLFWFGVAILLLLLISVIIGKHLKNERKKQSDRFMDNVPDAKPPLRDPKTGRFSPRSKR